MSTTANNDYISSLENLRDEYRKKLDSIEETLELAKEAFKNNNDPLPVLKNYGDYSPQKNIKEKIVLIFQKEKRFLHVRELAEIANSLEPSTKVDDFIRKFSGKLSLLKRDGVLTKIVIDGIIRNTVWGSVKWVDEEGKIKEGFENSGKHITKKIDNSKIEI